MLLNKVFQLLGPHLLPFSFIIDIVIMLNNFLTRFPVHLHDIWHKFTFPFELDFLLSDLLLLLGLFLTDMLFGVSRVFFCIVLFLFRLFVEVVSHPHHFFEEEVPVSFSQAFFVNIGLILKKCFWRGFRFNHSAGSLSLTTYIRNWLIRQMHIKVDRQPLLLANSIPKSLHLL